MLGAKQNEAGDGIKAQHHYLGLKFLNMVGQLRKVFPTLILVNGSSTPVRWCIEPNLVRTRDVYAR